MPMLPGRRRRGWGGTQRRAHVCARADATVRVKDVFRLLDDTGLLAPLAEGWGRSSSSTSGPAEAELDAHSEGSAPREGAGNAPWNDLMGLTGCVLPGHIPSSSRPTTHGSVGTHARGSPGAGSAGGAAVAMAGDGVGDAEGGYPAVGPEGHRQQSRSPTDSSSNRRSVLPSKTMPLHQNRLSAPSEEPKLNRLLTSPDVNTMVGFYSSECSAGGSVGGGQSGREVEDSLSQYDFSISFMEALQVLTEVLSPASLGRIRWSVAADEEPRQELITLLDYLEMEVTFAEFQRFLFRAVELAERRQGVASDKPYHQLLGAFLSKVFLPSLDAPYVPPSARLQEAQGTEGALAVAPPVAESPSPAALAVAGGEAAEGGAGEEAQSVGDSKAAPPPVFWRGFASDRDLRAVGGLLAEAHVPRWWPDDYAQEVADW